MEPGIYVERTWEQKKRCSSGHRKYVSWISRW